MTIGGRLRRTKPADRVRAGGRPDLPDADRSVVSNGEDPPPMRRERNARDRVVVTAQVHELQAEHRVANHRASIALPADEQPSIAAERDGFRKPCTAGDRVIPAIRPPPLALSAVEAATKRPSGLIATALTMCRASSGVGRLRDLTCHSRTTPSALPVTSSFAPWLRAAEVIIDPSSKRRPTVFAVAAFHTLPPSKLKVTTYLPPGLNDAASTKPGRPAGATKRTRPSAPAHGSRRWSLPSGRRG